MSGDVLAHRCPNERDDSAARVLGEVEHASEARVLYRNGNRVQTEAALHHLGQPLGFAHTLRREERRRGEEEERRRGGGEDGKRWSVN